MASSWERRDEDKEERLYNALGATLNRLIETYLPCPFWRKANNFRGLFVFLLYDVATINMAYIEIFLDYILYMC
jgi:hypothetical protein